MEKRCGEVRVCLSSRKERCCNCGRATEVSMVMLQDAWTDEGRHCLKKNKNGSVILN